MKKQIQGISALLGATVIWGSTFIAQSVGMDMLEPFTFQLIRCGLAVLFLIPVCWFFDSEKPGLQDFCRKWMDPALWKAGTVCGLALFFAASLQQIGLIYTDAGKAGFITAMYIVIVPVLGLFLGRKITPAAVVSVGIAVAGLYLLSIKDAGTINFGDICLILCAFAFAVQITFVDRYAGTLDGLKLNCVQALVVCLCSVPFVLFTETPTAAAIVSCWLPLGYAGILSMGVAYSLQIIGQKNVEPTTASLLMSLESVFAALFGWLLLRESMTGWELTGCCLVFSAVVISQIPSRK